MTIKQARRILGISPRASVEDIRTQFRQRAKQLHPDITGQADASAFIQLLAAYEELLNHLKEVGQSPDEEEGTDIGDLAWEWALREQEIRAAFDRIRQSFRAPGLSETLLKELADNICAYETATQLRNGIQKHSQTIARGFIARQEAKLRNEVATVLTTFNQKLDGLYLAFYEQVREQRRKWLVTSLEFWGVVAGTAIITVPLLSLWPGFSAQEVALYSSMVSVQGGYGIARLWLWRSGTREIIRLEPKGLAQFAVGLEVAHQQSDLEVAEAVGGGFVGLDFLMDGDLGILTVIGLALSALSWLFSPSLSKLKEKAISELENHIREHLKLEQRLDEYLQKVETLVLKSARETYLRNRRKAIETARRYPLLVGTISS